MDPPRWLIGLFFRPVRMFLVSIALAFVSAQLVMHTQRHNPNSHFFDPTPDTFAGPYSDARKSVARTWINDLDRRLQDKDDVHPVTFKHGTAPPELSVVFVCVRRPHEQYLDVSLGSFLIDIPAEQRKRIHVALSFGEQEPTQQPFFHTAWVHALVDEVAVRKQPGSAYLPPALTANHPTLPTAKLTVMPSPPFSLDGKDIQTKEWHRRSTLDYSLGLELCGRQGAPHCLIVEDDTVFAANWFPRFQAALRKADEWSGAGSHGRKRWAYMRLFYAEKYFGWENEEVQSLVVCCAGVVGSVALLLLLFGRVPARYAAMAGVRKRADLLHSYNSNEHDDADLRRAESEERKSSSLTGLRTGRIARVRLPLGTQLILILMTLFYCVLFILMGRNHVYRMPSGVAEMQERGCCTQAIAYPIDAVQSLIDHLRDRVGVRPYDILINRWVALQDRVKLAVHPPLVQHIGVGSTQSMVDETYLRSTPLWSFAFERVTAKLDGKRV